MKPLPAVEPIEEFAAGSWTNAVSTAWSLSMSTMIRNGSPWPRPPGSLSGAERVGAPVVDEHQDLIGGVGVEGAAKLSPCLNCDAA
jgi:hypothetical protein